MRMQICGGMKNERCSFDELILDIVHSYSKIMIVRCALLDASDFTEHFVHCAEYSSSQLFLKRILDVLSSPWLVYLATTSMWIYMQAILNKA